MCSEREHAKAVMHLKLIDIPHKESGVEDIAGEEAAVIENIVMDVSQEMPTTQVDGYDCIAAHNYQSHFGRL